MNDSDDDQTQQSTVTGRQSGSGSGGRAASHTVLLIDDSSRYHRLATNVLGDAGYRVVTATDGFDALAKVVEHRPAVVFTDALLPRLDGYQTCALMKNNSDFRDIPVVMFSSSSHPLNETRATMVGSSSSLSKPLTEHSLLEAVRHYAQLPTQTNFIPDNSTAPE